MNEFLNKLNRPKTYLLIANVFLVILAILLFNLDILPIKNLSDFIFYTIIYLAFALYRPGWSFLFFVGTIALENINLAPKEIGLIVRPYQFIGGLTILAVIIKLFVKRLGFKLPKWNRYDLLFIIFAMAGFISALVNLTSKLALKQSVIAASFVALYFLTRIFIQNLDDLKRIIPFFVSSSAIVVLYGIWQNVRFLGGKISFEFMPGRPNATFTEPDWLGIFLVLLLAALYALIYFAHQEKPDKKLLITSYWLLVTLTFISLILTVSRSAWLGAVFVTILFLFTIWTNLSFDYKSWQWKMAFLIKIKLIAAMLASISVVYFFHLTNFQLGNRAQSTGSGLQKITISCTQNITLPEKIESMDELAQFGCKHINLEEIQNEKNEGNFVKEIFRSDPNVNIRNIIYHKSWQEIKKHPIMGIGWGNISGILGQDANGNDLNSSNIFFEIWLGAGILGLVSFSLFLIFLLTNAIRNFLSISQKRTFGLFLLLGIFAIIIPNLFNAGILLGFVWVFLALAPIKE